MNLSFLSGFQSLLGGGGGASLSSFSFHLTQDQATKYIGVIDNAKEKIDNVLLSARGFLVDKLAAAQAADKAAGATTPTATIGIGISDVQTLVQTFTKLGATSATPVPPVPAPAQA